MPTHPVPGMMPAPPAGPAVYGSELHRLRQLALCVAAALSDDGLSDLQRLARITVAHTRLGRPS